MESLEEALAGALVSDSAKELVMTYSEMGIDALLEEGMARDIPVIGTIVGVTKMGANIRDRLFAKKLLEPISKLL